ncbi:hypothetical protein O3M35_006569 [Rhynocoris fuscipes]|uniref:Uncharacterized protein n=1 Tax=Rhynocoris fuscipes TaxID=488301 RepID=A0AAW1DLN7_9HEMI
MLVLVNLVDNSEGARRHKKTPVWLNPCRVHEHGRNKVRQETATRNPVQYSGRGHRASPRPLRRLRLQVTITYHHLIRISPSLPKIICNKASQLGTMINHAWLPRNQSQWYRKTVKCKTKQEKVTSLLPKFYQDLQRYSAAFEKLKSMRRNPAFSQECRQSRNKVLEDLSARVNLLQCETERTMDHMKIPIGEQLTEELANTFMPDYFSDITSGQLYEWGILSSYQDYINDWHRIIRQVVGRKGDAKCPNIIKERRKKLT